MTSQNRLTTAPEDSNSVLNDSFIVLTCANGYVNTGGSLNVTCLSTNSWTQFPNCVLGSGSGSITTTTLAPSSGLPCLIDASAFTITNGYYTSTSLSYVSATTATGESLENAMLSHLFRSHRIDTVCMYTRVYTGFDSWCNVCL